MKRLPLISKLPAILTLLVLLIALPLTVFLVQRQQVYLNRAASEDSKFGINIFKSADEPVELDEAYKRKVYESLRDAGIKWLRDGDGRNGRSITSWTRIEPEKGNWQWKKVDQDLALFQEYGFAYLGWIGDPPRWAELQNPNYSSDEKTSVRAHPNNLDDFANYVKQLVSRYGCKGGTCQIKYWEVGNEPNNNVYYIDHPESYAALLKIAYNTIKAVDPNAVVVLGGLGSEGIKSHPAFHKDIFEKYQAANYFDIFNFHAYGSTKYNGAGEGFGTFLDRGLAIRSQYCPQKPVWLTETASSSGDEGSGWQSIPRREEKQATDLSVRFNNAFDKGIDKVFWFRYKDNANPSNLWGTVGLLRDNLDPKPAYYAYQRIASSKPTPTPTATPVPTEPSTPIPPPPDAPPPTVANSITGFLWIDANGDGLHYWDIKNGKEMVYSCSGPQTKIKLELKIIGTPETPFRTLELEDGYFTFTDLEAKKYHLRVSQLPVCNGVEYQVTKWQLKTSPTDGSSTYISAYDDKNGTTQDANNHWIDTPFWSLKVNSNEITRVYFGIKPK